MEEPDQVFFGKTGRQLSQTVDLHVGNAEQIASFNSGFNHQQVTQICGQFACKITQIVTSDEHFFHQVEYLRSLLIGDGFDEASESGDADQPEGRCDVVLGDLIPAEGDHLIERRLRVAQAACAGASDLTQPGVAYFHTLAVGYLAQPPEYFFGRYLPELELLAARKYGVGNLVKLRRRHNKSDVRGRLFEGFQQGVKRAGRKHVDFVNDEDLITVAGRPDRDVVDDHVPHVVDAGVGRGVDFEHVERGARGDLDAGRALQAGAAGNARVTVETLGQYSRGGRLAGPPDAGKEVGMMKPPPIKGVAERARNVFLAC